MQLCPVDTCTCRVTAAVALLLMRMVDTTLLRLWIVNLVVIRLLARLVVADSVSPIGGTHQLRSSAQPARESRHH